MRKFIFLITLLLTINAYAEEHSGGPETFKKYFPGWEQVLKKEHLPVADDAVVTLTDIKTINYKWNHELKYKLSNNQEWKAPSQVEKEGKANCLGYSIVKYYELAKTGEDPANMAIVVGCLAGKDCSKDKNAIHAVVEVKTNKGSYVLDNRNDQVETAKDYFPSQFVVAYRINSAGWIQSMDGK